MAQLNDTSDENLILLGLSGDPIIQTILFAIFLVMFICIIVGNSFILTAIRVDPQLHTTMYFFLSNLSIIDVCYATVTVPKMMEHFLSQSKNIYFASCAAQMYLSLSFGGTECILLPIMAFDRHVTICNPLRYTSIMSRVVCIKFALCSCFGSFTNALFFTHATLTIPLCGHNKIKHYFCEVPAVLRLACRDVYLIIVLIYVTCLFLLIAPISFILISYIQIIISIMKINTTRGRKKAFSTCSSHITVVMLFYGTAMYVYIKAISKYTEDINKYISVLYTVITPMLNPLIYTFRNKEVKGALKKTMHIICFQRL